MLTLLSAVCASRQLDAARRAVEHLAELLDTRVSVELWDGSRIALGQNVHTELRIVIRGPGVIGALIRRPTLDNLVRLYATGQLDVVGGDLIEFFEAVRVKASRARLKQFRLGLLL